MRPLSGSSTHLRLFLAGPLLVACSAEPGPDPGRWFKGNTHAHTELCGHADSSPEAVAGWHLDHGFHFLVLSEHNRFIDPADVELPADRREDFILIAGEEISGPKEIHTTGMHLHGLVDASFDSEHRHEIIRNHAQGAREAGGLPILNHPNYGWAVKAADMLPVEELRHFELYNGHPAVHNEGDADHPSTEALWDDLLTAGKRIWGVSSDDMHELKTWGTEFSNPGRGWVMVRAEELTPAAITDAMDRGDFYSSNGVILSEVRVTDNGDGSRTYRVSVDEAATAAELESELLIGQRLEGANDACGTTIQWIGARGAVLGIERATTSEFTLTEGMPYLRCRVSTTRERPAEQGAELERFHAWTQPIFG